MQPSCEGDSVTTGTPTEDYLLSSELRLRAFGYTFTHVSQDEIGAFFRYVTPFLAESLL
jgi:hypothetical protein